MVQTLPLRYGSPLAGLQLVHAVAAEAKQLRQELSHGWQAWPSEK